jgi:hypothetical protein
MLKTASTFVLALLKTSTYRTKLTGGKVTLRSHLIEASGSSEAWYEESKPPGGKGTIRAHLIEGRGSSEAWYVPPRAFARCGLATGKARVLARAGWAGEKKAFLNIL